MRRCFAWLLLVAAPAAAAPTVRLADLAWLAGHWRGESDGRVVEEIWLAPRGGVMPGLNRNSTARDAQFEFLRIVEEAGALAYVASPGGGATTTFRASAASSSHVRFENPAHDFPKYVSYTASDASTLRACIGDAGREHCWQWKRVEPGG